MPYAGLHSFILLQLPQIKTYEVPGTVWIVVQKKQEAFLY